MTNTQHNLLCQALNNEAAPGRLLTCADTPDLLALCLGGFVEKGPYYQRAERDRLVKDIEAGVPDAMALLGKSCWWLTDKGREQTRQRRFS